MTHQHWPQKLPQAIAAPQIVFGTTYQNPAVGGLYFFDSEHPASCIFWVTLKMTTEVKSSKVASQSYPGDNSDAIATRHVKPAVANLEKEDHSQTKNLADSLQQLDIGGEQQVHRSSDGGVVDGDSSNENAESQDVSSASNNGGQTDSMDNAVPASNIEGRVFVGGISWTTTDNDLKEYFGKFGEIKDCLVCKDQWTRRSRGFGFISFTNSSVAKRLINKTHMIGGRPVQVKEAVPKSARTAPRPPTQTFPTKLFVGGLHRNVTEEEFREYFAQFGELADAFIMYNMQLKRSRGFGFITFVNPDDAKRCLSLRHSIKDKVVEIKKAIPRDEISRGPKGKRASGRNGGDNPTSPSNNSRNPNSGGRRRQRKTSPASYQNNFYGTPPQQLHQMGMGVPIYGPMSSGARRTDGALQSHGPRHGSVPLSQHLPGMMPMDLGMAGMYDVNLMPPHAMAPPSAAYMGNVSGDGVYPYHPSYMGMPGQAYGFYGDVRGYGMYSAPHDVGTVSTISYQSEAIPDQETIGAAGNTTSRSEPSKET